MMKLSVEKNNHIQELLGEASVKLLDLQKMAAPLVDDEIAKDFSNISRNLVNLDRFHFQQSYNSFMATVEKLETEMSEEEPG